MNKKFTSLSEVNFLRRGQSECTHASGEEKREKVSEEVD